MLRFKVELPDVNLHDLVVVQVALVAVFLLNAITALILKTLAQLNLNLPFSRLGAFRVVLLDLGD